MTEPHIFIGLSPLEDRTIFAAENEEGHQLFRVTAEEEVDVERDEEVRRYRVERIDGDGVHVARVDEDFPAGSHRGLRPKQRVVMRDRFGRRFEFSVTRSEPGGAVLRPARMSSLEILGEAPGDLASPDEGGRDVPDTRAVDAVWDGPETGADEASWDAPETGADEAGWDAPLHDPGEHDRGEGRRDAGPRRHEEIEDLRESVGAAAEKLEDPTAGVVGGDAGRPRESREASGTHPAAQAQLAEYVRLLDLMAHHGLRPLRSGRRAWQCFPFSVPQKTCERLLERDHALVREEAGVDYLELTQSGRDYLEANRSELTEA